MTYETAAVFSIGHSTLSYDRFLELLRSAAVTAVADVRSAPFSRHLPHFNRDILQEKLKLDGISYAFLGKELGGRPQDSAFFCDGVADYEKMARAPSFELGLKRVMEGAEHYRIALMCSEHNPLDCHRCLLVGRALKQRRVAVNHILSDGRIRSQADVEDELRAMAGNDGNQIDFFASSEDQLAVAYRLRGQKVAYAETSSDQNRMTAAE